MPDLTALFQMLHFVLKDRTQLALENIALRQQLAVYKRTVKRPAALEQASFVHA